MLSLAVSTAPVHPSRVTDAHANRDEETRRVGRALKALRERAGLSQAQAGDNYGTSGQNWAKYEAGQARSIHQPNVLRKLLTAVGATPEELQLALSNTDRPHRHPPARREVAEERRSFEVPIWGRARAGPKGSQVYDLNEPERTLDLGSLFGATTRATQVVGDSLYPKAASGTTIIYDLEAWPRRDQGCVVETLEGEYYVKIFDKIIGDKLYVTELQPEERTLDFDTAKLKGVYAVVAWITR